MTDKCPQGRAYDTVIGDCIRCDHLCDAFYGRERDCKRLCPGSEYKDVAGNANEIDDNGPILPKIQNVQDRNAVDSSSVPLYPILGAIIPVALVMMVIIYIVIKKTREKGHRGRPRRNDDDPNVASTLTHDSTSTLKEVVPEHPTTDQGHAEMALLRSAIPKRVLRQLHGYHSDPSLVRSPSFPNHRNSGDGRSRTSFSPAQEYTSNTRRTYPRELARVHGEDHTGGSSGYLSEEQRRDRRSRQTPSRSSSNVSSETTMHDSPRLPDTPRHCRVHMYVGDGSNMHETYPTRTLSGEAKADQSMMSVV